MSQKTIFIVLIAIILVVNHADSKRVGCASFGHSCYGGFGKRSLSLIPPSQDSFQQMDMTAEHPGNLQPPKGFQRQIQQQADNFEIEKELRMVVLNTLSQIIDDTLKKMTGDYETN